MYSDASKKRSTQLARQLDSLLEKERPGVPVTHLQAETTRQDASNMARQLVHDMNDALLPAHASQLVNRAIHFCLY